MPLSQFLHIGSHAAAVLAPADKAVVGVGAALALMGSSSDSLAGMGCGATLFCIHVDYLQTQKSAGVLSLKPRRLHTHVVFVLIGLAHPLSWIWNITFDLAEDILHPPLAFVTGITIILLPL